MSRERIWRCAWLTLLLLDGCADAPPQAAPVALEITAAADVNPDSQGRPSPVVLRLFQLRTEAEFSNAAFFQIYDDEKAALGASLVSRDEFTLAPGERRTLALPMATDARFIGALAAYRDPDAQWRAIAAPPASKLSPATTRAGAVTVHLDRASVVMQIK